MARPKEPRHRNRNTYEQKMAHDIDDLAEFEEFREQLLPALRKDLLAGMSAEDIYVKYQSIAAARNIQIAMTEADSGKALSAIRDILDRTQGKAKERVQHEHKFSKLKDEQLDALIKTKLSGTNETDEDSETH